MLHLLDDLFGPGTWGTGGNMVAWVICGVLAVTGGWIFKDVIGRKAAAWWAKHHGPHEIEQHLEALRRHEQEKSAGK
jgi:hypothetical protein